MKLAELTEESYQIAVAHIASEAVNMFGNWSFTAPNMVDYYRQQIELFVTNTVTNHIYTSTPQLAALVCDYANNKLHERVRHSVAINTARLVFKLDVMFVVLNILINKQLVTETVGY